MKMIFDYLNDLITRGGPEPSDYGDLSACYSHIGQLVLDGEIHLKDLNDRWKTLGEPFNSLSTMQGFVIAKPHGYPGDFEVIDRIYQRWVSPHSHLVKWDRYFHTQPATEAVRNRARYLKDTVDRIYRERERESASAESR